MFVSSSGLRMCCMRCLVGHCTGKPADMISDLTLPTLLISSLSHCRPSRDTSHLRTCHRDHTPSPAHTSTQRYAICSMSVFALERREAVCGCCSHSAIIPSFYVLLPQPPTLFYQPCNICPLGKGLTDQSVTLCLIAAN